jgi:hypothetical protein
MQVRRGNQLVVIRGQQECICSSRLATNYRACEARLLRQGREEYKFAANRGGKTSSTSAKAGAARNTWHPPERQAQYRFAASQRRLAVSCSAQKRLTSTPARRQTAAGASRMAAVRRGLRLTLYEESRQQPVEAYSLIWEDASHGVEIPVRFRVGKGHSNECLSPTPLVLKNQPSAVSYETKLLAIVYCAHAEAIFSKRIHTPHGFASTEIDQIKNDHSKHGVKEGWRKALDLALRKVSGSRTRHVANVQRALESLIERYIFDPSVLRNKIAHGQWVKALNRNNDAINSEMIAELRSLDVVELYRRKSAFVHLARIIEDLIESPQKAHFRDYWVHVGATEQ